MNAAARTAAKSRKEEAHLVERPRIGPTALKDLVDDALRFFLALAVRVRRDRERRPPPDTSLLLLGKVPIPSRELAVEPAVAAEVLGSDLRAGTDAGISLGKKCSSARALPPGLTGRQNAEKNSTRHR